MLSWSSFTLQARITGCDHCGQSHRCTRPTTALLRNPKGTISTTRTSTHKAELASGLFLYGTGKMLTVPAIIQNFEHVATQTSRVAKISANKRKGPHEQK